MGLGQMWRMEVRVTLLVLAGVVSTSSASIAAFPGAVGQGMYTSGGRGGDVYHVTNLNDSGPGSLRDAVSTGTTPRTVVFDVSGAIVLNGRLTISRPNITIAGQTAPGAGIEIYNWHTLIDTNNVILQDIHFRPGDAKKGPDSVGGFNKYALGINGQNIMVDHCSNSWSISQAMDLDGTSFNNVTIQNCLIGEGLDQTGLYHGALNSNYNPGGPSHHANSMFVKPKGAVGGVATATAYQNLLADDHSRNPCPGAYDVTQTTCLDFSNNVIYNCRNSGYSSGDANAVKLNYVGNYLITGPVSTSGTRAFEANAECHVNIYQSGNKLDTNNNGVVDGVDMTWSSFSGPYTQSGTPLSINAVPSEDADTAYNNVKNQAGAFWWNRDLVDQRIINDMLNGTGWTINSQKDRRDPNGILTDANGYLIVPVISRGSAWDTDGDGMPNWWESTYGTNPSLADNNGDLNGDGYTNLEAYLQSAAVPEPGTLSMLILGSPLTMLLRRKRHD